MIAKRAFQDEGLFEVQVLVHGQFRPRRPADQRRQDAAFLILQKDLALDSLAPPIDPGQVVDVHIAGTEFVQQFLALQIRRVSNHKVLLIHVVLIHALGAATTMANPLGAGFGNPQWLPWFMLAG